MKNLILFMVSRHSMFMVAIDQKSKSQGQSSLYTLQLVIESASVLQNINLTPLILTKSTMTLTAALSLDIGNSECRST